VFSRTADDEQSNCDPDLGDDLGLRKYTREWAPHDLTEAQKVKRVRLSRSLLESLHRHEDTEFKSPVTEDEPWVYCGYQEASMYTSSRWERNLNVCLVLWASAPMVKNIIGTSKVMITMFLGGEGRIRVDTLDPNETFTQDHFISFCCLI
jgi:hypothetical protein